VEWGAHIRHDIYPGSAVLALRGQGDVLFYGLYYIMTGLHALHIIIGLAFIGVVGALIMKDKINSENFVLLENSGLYWHLVDLIWIFLFPLFYLIT
jgi:cytochrome c oxidase subunit III